MGKPNIPLLRKYVEWVEWQDTLPKHSDQREWDQNNWFRKIIRRVKHEEPQPRDAQGRFMEYQEPNLCQTKCCVAGRVVLDAGFTMGNGGTIKKTPKGQEEWKGRGCSELANHILGLSEHNLFSASNTAQDVRRIAEGLAGERL